MAIVSVWDYQVKRGDARRMVALIQAACEQYHLPSGTPTYLSLKAYAPSGTRLVSMTEWKSYTDMEQWLMAFGTDPATHECRRQWSRVRAVSQGAEYWTVLEAPWSPQGKPRAVSRIAEVHDWRVKPGNTDGITALLRQTMADVHIPPETPEPLSLRAYSPSWTRFVLLAEWPSFADMEQWHAALGADPAGQECWHQLPKLVDYTHGLQCWDVLEAPPDSQEV